MTQNIKNLLIISIVIVLAFTALDFLGHKYLEQQYNLDVVPTQYFTNKIIFGTAILFGALLIIPKNKFSDYTRVSIIAAILVVTLQIRYYYLYSLRFNYFIMPMHYLILLPLLYIAQEKFKVI